MFYFIGWISFLLFFKIFLRRKVYGRENIPAKGAFLFVSNHSSYLDPILLGTAVFRSLNYMGRDTLFKKPMMRWALRRVNVFSVKRNEGDVRAIKESLKLLKTGKPLVMFPEGTRSKDKELKRGKPGAGFIVAKSGVPIVPAYIKGSFDALPRGRDTFKASPVSIYIGEPVIFEKGLLDSKDKGSYQKISDEIMRRIARLKDESEKSGNC